MRGEVEFSGCCEAIGDIEMTKIFIYLFTLSFFLLLLNYAQLRPIITIIITSVNRNLLNCRFKEMKSRSRDFSISKRNHVNNLH